MPQRTQTMTNSALPLELICYEPDDNPHPTPLLFIHGAWHGAWCWDEYMLPYFAQHGYRAHAVSLRGHGGSSGNARWSRAHDYVADVAYVANQFELPPILIGHSMGGYVIQKYLEAHTAPAAILLASIPVSGIFRFLTSRWFDDMPSTWRTLIKRSPYELLNTPEKFYRFGFTDQTPLTDVARFHKKIGEESFALLLDGSALHLPRPHMVPDDMPMLVLAGEQDAVFTVVEQQRTARAYHTDIDLFDMGHEMMLERGWVQVADHMLRWLGEQGF